MAATAVLKIHTAPEPAGASARELLHVARPEEPIAGASRAPQPRQHAKRPFAARRRHNACCALWAVQAHFA